MMTYNSSPLGFVVLYDPKDKSAWEAIEKNLYLSKQLGLLTTFDIHNDITHGDRDLQIAENLKSSQFVLALISPSFFTTCFFWIEQIKTYAKSPEILPILVAKNASFEMTFLKELQSVPSDGRFVSDWILEGREAEGFADIAQSIIGLVSND